MKHFYIAIPLLAALGGCLSPGDRQLVCASGSGDICAEIQRLPQIATGAGINGYERPDRDHDDRRTARANRSFDNTATVSGNKETSTGGDTADTADADTGGNDTGGNDTGGNDTGNTDTGSSDTGESNTGGSKTGSPDTGGSDSGDSDSGSSDTGNTDTGSSDTGASDAGASDTGGADSESPDAGDASDTTGKPGDKRNGNSYDKGDNRYDGADNRDG